MLFIIMSFIQDGPIEMRDEVKLYLFFLQYFLCKVEVFGFFLQQVVALTMTALTMDNADLVFVVVTSTAQLRIGKFVPLMGRSLTVNVK